jgi:hypothetical protein
MNIIRIAPRLTDAEEAVRIFCARTLKLPLAAELVYVPFVLFGYAAELMRFRGEKKILQGLFLADLIQGGPMNVPRGMRFEVGPGLDEELSRLTLQGGGGENNKTAFVRLEIGHVLEKQVLPMLLEREKAMARGKRLLRYDLMRLAGGLRYRKLDVRLLPGAKTVYYPLWLVYYRRRKGEVAFRVIDAVTRRREGGEVARSVAMGLVGKTPPGGLLKFNKGVRLH